MQKCLVLLGMLFFQNVISMQNNPPIPTEKTSIAALLSQSPTCPREAKPTKSKNKNFKVNTGLKGGCRNEGMGWGICDRYLLVSGVVICILLTPVFLQSVHFDDQYSDYPDQDQDDQSSDPQSPDTQNPSVPNNSSIFNATGILNDTLIPAGNASNFSGLNQTSNPGEIKIILRSENTTTSISNYTNSAFSKKARAQKARFKHSKTQQASRAETGKRLIKIKRRNNHQLRQPKQ